MPSLYAPASAATTRGPLAHRCQCWRFIGAGTPFSKHLPIGRDRTVWKPCHGKVQPGETMCDDCAQALLTCTNPELRAALANQPNTPDWTLVALTTDGDSTVSAIARGRVEARGGMNALRTSMRPGTQPVSPKGHGAASPSPALDPWATPQAQALETSGPADAERKAS